MAEKIPNHECQYCHKLYYACPDCEKNASWRAITCSPECYKEFMAKLINCEIVDEINEPKNESETKNNINEINVEINDDSKSSKINKSAKNVTDK